MKTKTAPDGDHRYFIWTIIFLIVSGISLVSYIMVTEIEYDAQMAEMIYVMPRR